jgi:hypothetical protein
MTDHGGGRHDRDADRWLTQIWQATTPPGPSEAAWAGVLAQIESSLAANPPQPRLPQRRVRRFPLWPVLTVGSLAAAAAAVLLVIILGGWVPRTPQPDPEAAITPLPVAGEGDVELISMDAADILALIVGRPPHQGPLVLASADEVFVEDTGHDVEVRVSADFRAGPSSPPMLIMPLDNGPGKE